MNTFFKKLHVLKKKKENLFIGLQYKKTLQKT